MIKIEIKDSVKIIKNINKIHYFVSGIEIFNFYFSSNLRYKISQKSHHRLKLLKTYPLTK